MKQLEGRLNSMSFNGSQLFEIITVLVGGLLLFKKVAEMNRYHEMRVVVLTTVLSCIVIYFFLIYGFTLGGPTPFDCSPDGFSQTEM